MPQPLEGGVARAAVVQDDRRLGGQAAHQPVPHHPATGGEPEQPVARLEIAVQSVLAQMLEQGAARAMDDALRLAGSTRRVEDDEWVVERQLGELQRCRLGEECLPPDGVAQLAAIVVDENDMLDRRNRVERPGNGGHDVVLLAVVPVAAHGDQNPGLDLTESVDDTEWSEVGGTRRPDRADRSRGEHPDHGLGTVRKQCRDAIAAPHTESDQSVAGAGNSVAQFRPGDLHRVGVLGGVDDRRGVIVTTQQVLGEVETCTGKPFRPGHCFPTHGAIRWR